MIKPTTADLVQYDSVTHYAPHHAYRSDELVAPDLLALTGHIVAARRAGMDAMVQVIKDRGDSLWTHAVYIQAEPVGEFGMQRYIVRLADGTEHMVDQSRIRPYVQSA